MCWRDNTEMGFPHVSDSMYQPDEGEIIEGGIFSKLIAWWLLVSLKPAWTLVPTSNYSCTLMNVSTWPLRHHRLCWWSDIFMYEPYKKAFNRLEYGERFVEHIEQTTCPLKWVVVRVLVCEIRVQGLPPALPSISILLSLEFIGPYSILQSALPSLHSSPRECSSNCNLALRLFRLERKPRCLMRDACSWFTTWRVTERCCFANLTLLPICCWYKSSNFQIYCGFHQFQP